MTTAGDVSALTLSVSPYDGTTAVTVSVTDPQGTITTPTATTSDSGATWSAGNLTFTYAGVYTVLWTIAGTGAGVTVERTFVEPVTATAATRSYATTQNYAEWTGEAPPTNIDVLLRKASMMIEYLTMTAVYDVDDDDMPTDSDVIAAMREATCELASCWDSIGDADGIASLVDTASIGNVSISYGGYSSGGSSDSVYVSSTVYTILRNAGLVTQAPYS